MAWLLRQGEVLASLEVIESARRPQRRLEGGGSQVGAVLRTRRATHTLGRRAPLDVAYLDADLVVLCTRRLARNRLGLPRRGARSLLEVEAGAFERWRLRPGDHLEIEA